MYACVRSIIVRCMLARALRSKGEQMRGLIVCVPPVPSDAREARILAVLPSLLASVCVVPLVWVWNIVCVCAFRQLLSVR